MKLIVLEPRGMGNVITSLPLLERAVQTLGGENVVVLCRSPYASVLESVESLDVRLVASDVDVLLLLLDLRRRGFLHFVAAPPISLQKGAALCAATRTVLIRPHSTYHNTTPIGVIYQELADSLRFGALGPPRIKGRWPSAPLDPPLTSDWNFWRRASRKLAVHLGSEANLSHKRWSIENFAACIEEVHRVVPSVTVAVVGTEVTLARGFLARVEGQVDFLNLTGRTSLEDAARFVRAADALLSGDSGLMHLAAALEVPAFAVFGPTSPHFMFPSVSRGRWFQNLACAGPCYPRITPGCRAARCVDRVQAADVARAVVAQLLNGCSPNRETCTAVGGVPARDRREP